MSADPIGLGAPLQQHAVIDTPLAHYDRPQLDVDFADDHHLYHPPDLTLDGEVEAGILDSIEQIETHLDEAHANTGHTQIMADYGLYGSGQTVAVIDSGIAYDHFALGAGLGTSYRVVGGWDFAEDDANPYDDAPGGGHGTHVSGIVGSDTGNPQTSGVAAGVDLVALRVFNDEGEGYFSWVEDALQWVHDNRNAFENPITTVNLSIGASWNSDSPPAWASLEDEFLQLREDGVFIAVSAGNSFTSYEQQLGLSYPAASPSVVPVMALNDDGTLAYFSQRHPHAIAAPGRWITSTVPDYVGNNNGQPDDWVSMSGTSMAAPYVAGASVLIREAMEFAGYVNITQDTIYDHIRDTADPFVDDETGIEFLSLNLEAAIDALMPADEFGSTVSTAHDLGTLVGSGLSESGSIQSRSDVDYFRFTAGSTGRAWFTATAATHELDVSWVLEEGTGSVTGEGGQVFAFDVVAGSEYVVGIGTQRGVGHYAIEASLSGAIDPIDWGSVAFATVGGVDNSGGTAWYQLQTTGSGYVTVEAFFDQTAGDVDLQLFDAELNLTDVSQGYAAQERVDAATTAGEMFYLHVTGANANINFRITNLVEVSNSTATIHGTEGNDNFVVTAGDTTHAVSVNGVTYAFDAASLTNIQIEDGGGGHDVLTAYGTSGNEIATLAVGSLTVTGGEYTIAANDIEQVEVYGGGGYDQARFLDTAGDETYIVSPTSATMTGSHFAHTAHDFAWTVAEATGGDDRAYLYDSKGSDLFRGWHNVAVISGDGFYNRVDHFDRVYAYASEGQDEARFYDSPTDDLYRSWDDRAVMMGDHFYNFASNFDRTLAFSSAGHDTARMYDSAANDLYRSWKSHVVMMGDHFYNFAGNFAQTYAYSTGGVDEARMYDDTLGDDLYRAWSNQVVMSGDGYYNVAQDFRYATGFSLGGNDVARLYDTADGDEVYQAHVSWTEMAGSQFTNYTFNFRRTYAYARGGVDRAYFFDSEHDDLYRTWDVRAIMMGDGYYNLGEGFDRTYGFASSGADEARFYDSASSDLYRAWDSFAIMMGSGYYNRADQFEVTRAFSTEGLDEARFYDSIGADVFTSQATTSSMTGAGYANYGHGFAFVLADAGSGYDRAVLYDTSEDDSVHALTWGTVLNGGYYARVCGFDEVEVRRINGGSDSSVTESVDYLFSLVGDWD